MGRMAAAWNLPMFALGATYRTLNNKEIYNTLTRLSYSHANLAHFYINVLLHFRWSHVTVMYDGEGTRFIEILYVLCGTQADSVHAAFGRAGLQSTLLKFSSDEEYVEPLRKGNASSRGM
jgi:hypothetical protein